NATALNVVNTTIGAAHLNFQSISAGNSDAGADPASGIILNNTGSSGSLIVTGNGSTAQGGDNSGGTIQNTTSDGISLTNTLSPSFTNIKIDNTGRHGINGDAVTNFTLNYSTINNAGSGSDENGINFNRDATTGVVTNPTSVTGVVTITHNNITLVD